MTMHEHDGSNLLAECTVDVQPDRPLPLICSAIVIAGLLLAGTIVVINDVGQSDAAPVPPVVPVPTPAPAVVAEAPVAPAATEVAVAPAISPIRSLFLLGDGLSPAQEALLFDGMAASGLPVVERERIDTLLAEQEMGRAGLTSTETSVRIGRLLGGHLAMIVRQEDGLIALRVVLVETGEILVARSCVADELPAVVAPVLDQACARLPAVGLLSLTMTEERPVYAINLGRQHGIRVDDRFAVYSGPPEQAGEMVAMATVMAVTATGAEVALSGPGPHGPAMVRRFID